MKDRDYSLIKDGKYNIKSSMEKPCVYVLNYGYSLKSALRISWAASRLAMDEYVESLKPKAIEPKQGNVLKAFFADKYANYDSSWR